MRRVALGFTQACAVAAVLTTGACTHPGAKAEPGLDAGTGGSTIKVCLPVTKAQARRGIGVRTPVAFGLGDLRQTADAVVVKKVELVGVTPSGSLALAKTAMAPEPGVGILPWTSRALAHVPHWKDRLMVPSTQPLRARGKEIEIVAGLVMRDKGGWAKGIRLTVETNGRTSKLTLTHNRAGLVQGPYHVCDHNPFDT